MAFDACQTRKCVTVDLSDESRTSYNFSLSRTPDLDRRIELKSPVASSNCELYNYLVSV